MVRLKDSKSLSFYINTLTMTYYELLESLQALEEEQLDHPVMAIVDEEFYKVVSLRVQEGQDQLSDGHAFLEIE
jgi:hypothetical protein